MSLILNPHAELYVLYIYVISLLLIGGSIVQLRATPVPCETNPEMLQK